MLRLIACVVAFGLGLFTSAIAAPKFFGEFTVDQANCSIEGLKDATFVTLRAAAREKDGAKILRIAPVGGKGKAISLLTGTTGTYIEPGFEGQARNRLQEIWSNQLEGNTLTNRYTYRRPRFFKSTHRTTVLIDHGAVVEIRVRSGRGETAICRLNRR